MPDRSVPPRHDPPGPSPQRPAERVRRSDAVRDLETARSARGARHVRIGLAASVTGSLAMVAMESAGVGAGEALGARNFVGGVLAQLVLVAAVLSASRIARALVIVYGVACTVAGGGLALAGMLAPDRPWPLDTPLWFMAGCTLLAGVGSLLATVSPAADAWFVARRAARAARRKAKPLADWRAAE